MTDEQAKALGERAVACKGWRWMPGMRDFDERRVTEAEMMWGKAPWAPPDFRDPASIGCLLALVREAWGWSMVWAMADNTECGWWVESWDADVPALIYATEAEALVAALEGAP